MADVSQIELNGTTYDICDATARDTLSYYFDEYNNLILYHNADVDRDGSAPSNKSTRSMFFSEGKNPRTANMGAVQSEVDTNGDSLVGLAAVNQINANSSIILNTFKLGIHKGNGTPFYNISAPAALRDELNLNRKRIDTHIYSKTDILPTGDLLPEGISVATSDTTNFWQVVSGSFSAYSLGQFKVLVFTVRTKAKLTAKTTYSPYTFRGLDIV